MENQHNEDYSHIINHLKSTKQYLIRNREMLGKYYDFYKDVFLNSLEEPRTKRIIEQVGGFDISDL